MASSAVPGDSQGGAEVTEGKATIYFPSEKGVFYNPPQIPNRDLSVLALREFAKQWQREAAQKAAKGEARRAAKTAAAASSCEAKPATTDGTSNASGGSRTRDGTDSYSQGLAKVEPAGVRVLDAMTASGLRALRYVLEVPQVHARLHTLARGNDCVGQSMHMRASVLMHLHVPLCVVSAHTCRCCAVQLTCIHTLDQVTSVVANDLEPAALLALRENVRRNGLTEEQVMPSEGDAVAVMQRSKPPDGHRFEAVEIDPYGTAAPFLDSAVQCVAEGERAREHSGGLHIIRAAKLLTSALDALMRVAATCDAES